jgi:hypothetical protein
MALEWAFDVKTSQPARDGPSLRESARKLELVSFVQVIILSQPACKCFGASCANFQRQRLRRSNSRTGTGVDHHPKLAFYWRIGRRQGESEPLASDLKTLKQQ